MAKTIKKSSVFDGIAQTVSTHTDTHTDTPTHTHEYTQQKKIPPVKERKTRRVQLLLKESTVNLLDDYAQDHGTSRNDVIQTLMEDFLSSEGYISEK